MCVAVRFQKKLSNCPTAEHPGSLKPRQHAVLVGLPSPKMSPSSLGDQAKLPKCNAPESEEKLQEEIYKCAPMSYYLDLNPSVKLSQRTKK